MGDDSRKVSAVELVQAPPSDFQHDDWNQLYDIVAHEYFVPMDSRIPGIGGKCYWPRWVILSRKLKMAQPSWYDVQKNTDPKDSNDIQPSASLSLAASLVSSTPPLKTTPSTFRRKSRRSVTEEKNCRPSRSVKNLVQSYAELPDEAEIITIEDGDNEKEFPPAKRLRGETLIKNKGKILFGREQSSIPASQMSILSLEHTRSMTLTRCLNFALHFCCCLPNKFRWTPNPIQIMTMS